MRTYYIVHEVWDEDDHQAEMLTPFKDRDQAIQYANEQRLGTNATTVKVRTMLAESDARIFSQIIHPDGKVTYNPRRTDR